MFTYVSTKNEDNNVEYYPDKTYCFITFNW